MDGLSFGEQVKIILSRRNMTIKELAEQIQERTGKAMSRQNLTQRLGRDNFQEKDMRMIAAILGCPFRLSIFPADAAEDEKIMEYANASTQKRRSKTEEVREDERDMTIGELYEIHEELKELEAAAVETAEESEEPEVSEAEVTEAVAEPIEEAEEEMPVEVMQEEQAEITAEEETAAEEESAAHEEQAVPETQEPTMEQTEEVVKEAAEPEEKPAEKKKEKFHTGGIFLRRMQRGGDTQKIDTKKVNEAAKAETKKEAKPVITPDSEDFEPVIKHKDAEEDLSIGEMNPYTGREYQTNSVRMHPHRIGYVQVYDRNLHQWTDMTEWAFLGYQERKKALLGRDYEPPIYLD